MNSIAAQARPILADFKQQELTNTAWALAKIDFVHSTLFQAIASKARNTLSEFSS